MRTGRWVGLAVACLAAAAPAAAQDEALHNLAAASAGGRLLWFSSQFNDTDWAAARLIDGIPGDGWAGRSGGPQTVILGFRDGALAAIEDVVINPYTREDASNWVRQAEIHVSTTYPFRDFEKVATLSLTDEGIDQVVSFAEPVPARYLKVVFLANRGGGYMEAGEVRAIGRLVPDAPPAPAWRALHEGAALERFSSEFNDSDWSAVNLLASDGAGGQWSGRNEEAQEIVLRLAEAAPVTDVAVDNYSREEPANWVRSVEVQLSPSSPYRDFTSVGALTLQAVGDLHTLTLAEPVTARYVKLVFRGNGGGGYMQAGRVRVYSVAPAAPADGP